MRETRRAIDLNQTANELNQTANTCQLAESAAADLFNPFRVVMLVVKLFDIEIQPLQGCGAGVKLWVLTFKPFRVWIG